MKTMVRVVHAHDRALQGWESNRNRHSASSNPALEIAPDTHTRTPFVASPKAWLRFGRLQSSHQAVVGCGTPDRRNKQLRPVDIAFYVLVTVFSWYAAIGGT